MPKQKTSKTAAKRFKRLSSGRIKRSKSGGQHKLHGKSRSHRRRLRDNDTVSPADQKRIRSLIGS